MNNDITAYISAAPEEQRKIMEALRQLMQETVPGLVENFKWSRPVFSAPKDFAYLKSSKAYVTLGFFDFEKIRNYEDQLEGTGKDMRHIKLKKVSDINTGLLKEWLQALTK